MDQKLPYGIEAITSIPGATEIVDWFGQWPTFHDAYLVDIVLSTWQPCLLRLHLSKGPGGPFIADNEGMVTLYIEPPSHYEIEGIRPGGQLLGLTICQHPAVVKSCWKAMLLTECWSHVRFPAWIFQFGHRNNADFHECTKCGVSSKLKEPCFQAILLIC